MRALGLPTKSKRARAGRVCKFRIRGQICGSKSEKVTQPWCRSMEYFDPSLTLFFTQRRLAKNSDERKNEKAAHHADKHFLGRTRKYWNHRIRNPKSGYMCYSDVFMNELFKGSVGSVNFAPHANFEPLFVQTLQWEE